MTDERSPTELHKTADREEAELEDAPTFGVEPHEPWMFQLTVPLVQYGDLRVRAKDVAQFVQILHFIEDAQVTTLLAGAMTQLNLVKQVSTTMIAQERQSLAARGLVETELGGVQVQPPAAAQPLPVVQQGPVQAQYVQQPQGPPMPVQIQPQQAAPPAWVLNCQHGQRVYKTGQGRNGRPFTSMNCPLGDWKACPSVYQNSDGSWKPPQQAAQPNWGAAPGQQAPPPWAQ